MSSNPCGLWRWRSSNGIPGLRMAVWSQVNVCGRRLNLRPIGCTPALSMTQKCCCSCSCGLWRSVSVVCVVWLFLCLCSNRVMRRMACNDTAHCSLCQLIQTLMIDNFLRLCYVQVHVSSDNAVRYRHRRRHAKVHIRYHLLSSQNQQK